MQKRKSIVVIDDDISVKYLEAALRDLLIISIPLDNETPKMLEILTEAINNSNGKIFSLIVNQTYFSTEELKTFVEIAKGNGITAINTFSKNYMEKLDFFDFTFMKPLKFNEFRKTIMDLAEKN